MSKSVQGALMALLLVVGGIVWRLVYLHYATAYLEETVHTAIAPLQTQELHNAQVLQAQAQRNAYVAQAQAQHRAPAPLGRQLAGNERCIGGSIVRVDEVNGVPAYTQESDGMHPVACPQPR